MLEKFANKFEQRFYASIKWANYVPLIPSNNYLSIVGFDKMHISITRSYYTFPALLMPESEFSHKMR